eukprot:2114028-Pyramimonas_sp.AAC.1
MPCSCASLVSAAAACVALTYAWYMSGGARADRSSTSTYWASFPLNMGEFTMSWGVGAGLSGSRGRRGRRIQEIRTGAWSLMSL